MRTTLNLPDSMVREAKMRALQEGSTLTDLLVQGLKQRLEASSVIRELPVSAATGGLCAGSDWFALGEGTAETEVYR